MFWGWSLPPEADLTKILVKVPEEDPGPGQKLYNCYILFIYNYRSDIYIIHTANNKNFLRVNLLSAASYKILYVRVIKDVPLEKSP